eukprot:8155214-Lingulodinium_polyedra.AAC.1
MAVAPFAAQGWVARLSQRPRISQRHHRRHHLATQLVILHHNQMAAPLQSGRRPCRDHTNL